MSKTTQNYDLSIQINNGKIVSNLQTLKESLKEQINEYANIVYSGEEALAEMKKDRATLNNLAKEMEQRKKEIKEQYLAPWKAFETELKELTDVVKSTSKAIDNGVKEIEKQMKVEKQKQIEQYYDTYAKSIQFDANPFCKELFNRIYDEKWTNKTATAKTYKTAIETAVNNYLNDVSAIEALNEPQWFDMALSLYQQNLDVKEAFSYITEQQKIRAKEEAERIKREAEIKAEIAAAKARAEAEFLKEKEQIRQEEAAKAKAEAEKKIAEALENEKKISQEVFDKNETSFVLPKSEPIPLERVETPIMPTTNKGFFGIADTQNAVQQENSLIDYNDEWELCPSSPFDTVPERPKNLDMKNYDNSWKPCSNNLFDIHNQKYVSEGFSTQNIFLFGAKETVCTLKIKESDYGKVAEILARENIWYKKE